jgi:uncharacterized protein YndB with AHSA1/START domain
MSEERVTVSRRIKAPASRLFALVSDPETHVAIDGSGMLMSTPDAAPKAVGDTFDMNMDREPLGDIPMGKYQVRNTVTRFEPDNRFEWTVGGADRPPVGHLYGYVLTPAGAGETDVDHYCDWAGADPKVKARVASWPVVPVHMLERTLEKLDTLASS